MLQNFKFNLMMKKMIKMAVISLLLSTGIISCNTADDKWIPLFNGSDLDGWVASENAESFYFEDGLIVADGPRSHLFYNGTVMDADFRNFELRLEIMTTTNANSGVYFHTEFQETGWPDKGYEVQVLNSNASTVDRIKTGSLYAVRNIFKPLASEGEWFDMHIVVKGNRIQAFVNGIQTADYTEPGNVDQVHRSPGRRLSSGTFALQCHGMGEKVYYRSIRVLPLPDDLSLPPGKDYFTNEKQDHVTRLIGMGYPIIDYHVHLKGGVTIEDVVDKGLRTGVFGSIAPNCGVGFPVDTNDKLEEFYNEYKDVPVFLAMQAEGREWVNTFEKESIARYDYVFTDAMTFSNAAGKRMRLWMEEEVEVGNPEEFMELLVSTIENVLDEEKIDIYVNPTFLPSEIQDRYNELWTEQRIGKVVDALVRNGIAMEINARYRLPGEAVVRMAKERGVKFAFGTNNSDHDFANLDYCFEMIEACEIRPGDMFFPKPKGMKPIQVK